MDLVSDSRKRIEPVYSVKFESLPDCVTEWDDFRALDLGRLVGLMETPGMADPRNVYAAADVRNAGFEAYVAVAR